MSTPEKLPFTYVIGLEVHAELNTRTKMFCRCINNPFGATPNEHTCPVCAGLPGALPVPNAEAIRKTVLLGKALGSTIPPLAHFDRKHYFYPDNPKGYQISQYDIPFCIGGELALLDAQGQPEKVIRFERVHLEEDAGKLLHGSEKGFSQVDLNRAGVPLVEMVSKPDLASPEDARRFMQELRLIVRTLGVSDADMEKGQMRADVNISIKFEHDGQQVWTPITEIKNVNSTRAVERSLIVEGQRLYTEWVANGPVRTRVNKVTAGWDENTGLVVVHRAKENANDYRYFPEPDIPPVAVYERESLHPDHMEVPELPNQRRVRYLGLGISLSDTETLLNDIERLELLEHLQNQGVSAKAAANWLINASGCVAMQTSDLGELIGLATDGGISFAAVKPRLDELVTLRQNTTESLSQTLESMGLLQRFDLAVVQSAVSEILAAHPEAVAQYRSGDMKLFGFLMGQVLKKIGGSAPPAKVQEVLRAALL
jgi:aspartyl-tRNA(Asn)/glutamyl-tRNA(Gln) amidotransferase subunit B